MEASNALLIVVLCCPALVSMFMVVEMFLVYMVYHEHQTLREYYSLFTTGIFIFFLFIPVFIILI